MEKKSGTFQEFNLKQSFLVEISLRFPAPLKIYCLSLPQRVKITIRTLQRDLKDMMDKQIIKAQGATNKQFYYLTKKV